MPTMKVDKGIVQELSYLDPQDGEYEGFLVVEQQDWIHQDYKYQNKEVIVQHLDSGDFFSFVVTRSGSPFSDWHYDWWEDKDDKVTLTEVEKLEVISHKWITI